jgi:LysM repeat protein
MALLMLDIGGAQTVSTLNPFNTPGSPMAERQRRRRERFKIGVMAFVAMNIVLFLGLLIQGCQREPGNTDTAAAPPVPDTNETGVAAGTADTNSAVPPTSELTPTNAYASTETKPVPAAPAATTDYTVVKGDSFSKIAKAQKVTVRALTEANPGVDSAKLKVGQVLHVPQSTATAMAPSTTPSAPTAPKASPAKGSYTVKSGDTLGRIAKAHGTTVKALKAANGLTSDRIAVGAKLKLPGAKKPAVAAT